MEQPLFIKLMNYAGDWLRVFDCPDCKGEGGDYVPILWKGMGGGPYEPCYTCNDNYRIGFLNWLHINYLKLAGKWL